MKKYQFVGLDFAFTDPRSVAASLCGCGNGISENYDRYYKKNAAAISFDVTGSHQPYVSSKASAN
jgi:hypothetical protein